MFRKVKKYLKFVVCCTLILSLIAPSYAALSASDGSAFVTKAEFDSALADFNARLTTFEAGINSKIDSQVTSYLDRNGIWNGALQTLTKSTYYEWNMNQFNYWKNVRGDIATGANEHRIAPAAFINDVNKSGLLYLTFDVAARINGSDGRCCQIFYYTQPVTSEVKQLLGSKYTTPCTTRCFDCDILQTDASCTDPYGEEQTYELKTSVSLAASQPAIILDDQQNASGTLGDYDSLFSYHKSDSPLFTIIAIPLTVSLGRRNCLTFVEKGKKIWWALKDTLSFTSTNMQAAMQNEDTYVYEYSWGRVRFQNISAKVY